MNINKKRFGLLTLLCMLSLLGCGINSRVPFVNVGYPKTIMGNNTIEVTGSTVSDGKIVVTLFFDFEDLTLNDFLDISLSTLEYSVDPLPCNVEETVKENEANIFDTPYQGTAFLVFTDDSISAQDNISRYYMEFEYGNKNGTLNTNRFMISE